MRSLIVLLSFVVCVDCFWFRDSVYYLNVVERVNSSLREVYKCTADIADFGAEVQSGSVGCYIPVQPFNACTPVQPAPKVCGDNLLTFGIASRGHCRFDEKSHNVQKANYSGLFIVNTQGTGAFGPSGSRDDITIAVFGISKECGQAITHMYTAHEGFYFELEQLSGYDFVKYLWPFVVVLGICFLILLTFVIVKYVRQRQRISRRRLSKRNLRKIPTKKYKKGDPYECCPICLEDFEDNEKLRVLPCGHAYHCNCVDPWLTKNRKVCPVCKRKVIPAGSRQQQRSRRQRRRQDDSSSDSDDTSSTSPESGSSENTRDRIVRNMLAVAGRTQPSSSDVERQRLINAADEEPGEAGHQIGNSTFYPVRDGPTVPSGSGTTRHHQPSTSVASSSIEHDYLQDEDNGIESFDDDSEDDDLLDTDNEEQQPGWRRLIDRILPRGRFNQLFVNRDPANSADEPVDISSPLSAEAVQPTSRHHHGIAQSGFRRLLPMTNRTAPHVVASPVTNDPRHNNNNNPLVTNANFYDNDSIIPDEQQPGLEPFSDAALNRTQHSAHPHEVVAGTEHLTPIPEAGDDRMIGVGDEEIEVPHVANPAGDPSKRRRRIRHPATIGAVRGGRPVRAAPPPSTPHESSAEAEMKRQERQRSQTIGETVGIVEDDGANHQETVAGRNADLIMNGDGQATYNAGNSGIAGQQAPSGHRGDYACNRRQRRQGQPRPPRGSAEGSKSAPGLLKSPDDAEDQEFHMRSHVTIPPDQSDDDDDDIIGAYDPDIYQSGTSRD